MLREKKILLAAHETGFGGGERIFEDIVKASIEEGFKVHCVVQEHSELDSRLAQLGISKSYFNTEIPAGFDYLIANDFKSLLHCYRSAKSLSLICHGPWELNLKKSLVYLVLKVRVLCVSGYVANSAPFFLGSRLSLEILNYGPSKEFRDSWHFSKSESREKLGIPQDAFVVSNVSRFHPVKRLDLFLEVVEKAKLWPALAVSQSFFSREENDSFSKFRTVSKNHSPLTTIYNEDPRWVLSAADVFLSTSESETLGVAILEAQTFGLPVFSTAAGGAWEIVRQGLSGMAVAPNKALDLVPELRAVAKDSQMLEDLKEVALSQVKRRSPTIALYELIGGCKR